MAHAHLRYLNPLPANLGELLKRYEQVLIPELNLGQLRLLIRGEFLVDAVGLNKVQGKPFTRRRNRRKDSRTVAKLTPVRRAVCEVRRSKCGRSLIPTEGTQS